ncbi:MAG: hypothetical protein Q8Q23_04155 [bacterium]|nr:hypothetical protein [bacterium]
MAVDKNTKKILADDEVRKLVMARLSVLSKDTMISLGSEGSFTRDELIKSVKSGDNIGEKLAEIQLEWLRSFKERVSV